MTRTIASHMPYATACEETIKSHTGERIPQGGNLNLVKFHLTTLKLLNLQERASVLWNEARVGCPPAYTQPSHVHHVIPGIQSLG